MSTSHELKATIYMQLPSCFSPYLQCEGRLRSHSFRLMERRRMQLAHKLKKIRGSQRGMKDLTYTIAVRAI